MESLWPVRGYMEEHSLAFIKTSCKVLDQRHVSYLSASARIGYQNKPSPTSKEYHTGQLVLGLRFFEHPWSLTFGVPYSWIFWYWLCRGVVNHTFVNVVKSSFFEQCDQYFCYYSLGTWVVTFSPFQLFLICWLRWLPEYYRLMCP